MQDEQIIHTELKERNIKYNLDFIKRDLIDFFTELFNITNSKTTTYYYLADSLSKKPLSYIPESDSYTMIDDENQLKIWDYHIEDFIEYWFDSCSRPNQKYEYRKLKVENTISSHQNE